LEYILISIIDEKLISREIYEIVFEVHYGRKEKGRRN
jgi:hypothetical protein